MSSLRILDDLPDDVRVEAGARSLFAVRSDLGDALREAGYPSGPEETGRAGGGLRESTFVGRKPLREIETRQGTFVVRRFSHGGLLRFATGARFLDSDRPFRELIASRFLLSAGIATPEVVAARARALPLFGWELEVVTRRIDDAIDLGWVLGMVRRGEVERSALRIMCAAAGILVAKLHALGFLHADLTPNNLLVNRSALAGAEPRILVLDLDRARIPDAIGAIGAIDDEARRTNLRRLHRFVVRREMRDGRALSRTDIARFFVGYDPGGTRWKDDWRAIAKSHARTALMHRAGWALESLVGKGRDVREAQASPRSAR